MANVATRSRPGLISAHDTPHAPFVFFEWAPTSGCANGIVSVTLSAHRTQVFPDGEISVENVVVAHLRGSIQAALNLRNAIDIAIDRAERKKGKATKLGKWLRRPLDDGPLPDASGVAGIPQDTHALDLRHQPLSSSSRLALKLYSNWRKPVALMFGRASVSILPAPTGLPCDPI